MNEILSILELTKSKYNLLEKMEYLELTDQVQSKEYFTYFGLYKKTCEYIHKKNCLLSTSMKEEFLDNLKSLNPNLFSNISFIHLLNVPSQYLILKRMILDFNDQPLFSTCPKIKNNLSDHILSILEVLFDDSSYQTKNEVDANSINHCISQDFINVFFYFLENKIKKEKYIEIKALLLHWKYCLLLLSSSLEYRFFYLQPDFTSMDNISLVDNISIQTLGIPVEKYMKLLDNFIVDYISSLLNRISSNSDTDYFLLEQLVIESLSSLLSDKEYIDIINIESISSIYYDTSQIITEKIDEVVSTLKFGKQVQINTLEHRKFKKI